MSGFHVFEPEPMTDPAKEKRPTAEIARSLCVDSSSHNALMRDAFSGMNCNSCHRIKEALDLERTQISQLEGKVKELEADVREWICETCRIVYPSIADNQRFPKGDCGHYIFPRGIVERKNLEADLAKAREECARLKQEASGMMKLLDRHAKHEAVTEWLNKVESILSHSPDSLKRLEGMKAVVEAARCTLESLRIHKGECEHKCGWGFNSSIRQFEYALAALDRLKEGGAGK